MATSNYNIRLPYLWTYSLSEFHYKNSYSTLSFDNNWRGSFENISKICRNLLIAKSLKIFFIYLLARMLFYFTLPYVISLSWSSLWEDYLKINQIQSYFWSVFSCIRTKYGDLGSKSPYLVRLQENTDQKYLRIWTHFMQSGFSKIAHLKYVVKSPRKLWRSLIF